MRVALFITVIASALLASATAFGASAAPVRRAVFIERCVEQPMSLALAIAEHEASRSLAPRALTSNGERVFATPAPRVARIIAHAAVAPVQPFSPLPRACLSPDDPGCHVSGSTPSPQSNPLGHAAHGLAAAFPMPAITAPRYTVRPIEPVDTRARLESHTRGVWRPPAR